MSDKSPYERLEVGEEATFDEIQDAKSRLVQLHSGDRKQVEAIEAAYDAVLMDRLRLRQEGKIKVPDRIRFPERLIDPPPDYTPATSKHAPDWLQRLIDTPSRADILLPGGLFLGAGLLSLSSPSLALALGVGFSLYFLNRKEQKFGRAFLLTLIGLVVGVVLGLQIGNLLVSQIAGVSLAPDTVAAMITFVILWIVSSFLR